MKFAFAFLWLCLAVVAAAQAQPSAPALVDTSRLPTGLVGYFMRPADTQGVLPGVIVLGGSEGGLDPAVRKEAQLIADHGYAVLQLGYFGAPHLPETLQLIPLEYFMKAVAWLRTQPGVDAAHIGIVGTSIGGEVALLVGAHDPAITVVVAAVPSNAVWQGIGGWLDQNPASSFSLAGEPLPDLPFGWTGKMHDIFNRYARGLAALPQHPSALIPVEAINGPVMLICGERDTIWPSCVMAAAAAARLRQRGFPHSVAFLDFPEAGHAVFGPPMAPNDPEYPNLGGLGGSAAANNAARQVDWPRFLAFLDAALKPQRGREVAGLTATLRSDNARNP